VGTVIVVIKGYTDMVTLVSHGWRKMIVFSTTEFFGDKTFFLVYIEPQYWMSAVRCNDITTCQPIVYKYEVTGTSLTKIVRNLSLCK